MTKTPELDRAIEAGTKAVCGTTDKLIIADRRKQRAYARALVAELLRGIECKLRDEPLIPAAQAGANAALAEIRRIVGIVEGEG